MGLCECGCGSLVKSGMPFARGHHNRSPEHRQRLTSAKTTHGKNGTKVYDTWINIKQRCHNPKVPHYERYGARGVTVCDRWRESFDNFYNDMGDPPEGLELDRIDNSRGYEPGNCKWVTRSENNRHRRSTRWVEVDGRMVSMAEAVEITGIPTSTMKNRLNKNQDPLKGRK